MSVPYKTEIAQVAGGGSSSSQPEGPHGPQGQLGQLGREPRSDTVASEFYTLSFMEKKYADSSSLAAYDSTVQSSPSVAMSSRDQKNRHLEIVRKRSVETKKPARTIPEQVIRSMRVSERMSYCRGHILHMPGSPIARHPPGCQPVVLRNHETGNKGRNAGTFRPHTAAEQRDRAQGTLKRTMSREATAQLYSRDTNPKVLNSNGNAIAASCSKSSWHFKAPLDRVFCSRPSSIASALAYAPVPDCAEAILSEGPYGTVAGAAKLTINDKTTMRDKLYLVDQRPKTTPMAQVRQPKPHMKAPYRMDYEPRGSPERRPRDVFRHPVIS